MEEQKLTPEQLKEREEQILQGKRGHCLEMAIRVHDKEKDDGDTVLKNARKFLEYLQNG